MQEVHLSCMGEIERIYYSVFCLCIDSRHKYRKSIEETCRLINQIETKVNNWRPIMFYKEEGTEENRLPNNDNLMILVNCLSKQIGGLWKRLKTDSSITKA
jgi:hypothetical protein